MRVKRYVVHCGRLGSFAIDAFTRAHAIAICVHSFTKSCYEFHPADVLKWRVEQEVGEGMKKENANENA